MRPRFTDKHRYPHGYRKADQTDVRATFARVRERQAAAVDEAKAKVTVIQPRVRKP